MEGFGLDQLGLQAQVRADGKEGVEVPLTQDQSGRGVCALKAEAAVSEEERIPQTEQLC